MTLLPTRMIAAATLMGVLILRVIVTLILRVTVVILHPMKKVLTRFVPKRQPKQRKRPRPQLLRLPLGSLLRRTGKASRFKLIWGLIDGAQAQSAGTPFRRVDDQFWGEVAYKYGGAMADNSYEGAFGGNGFGARASQKLLQVQGKRFQHEKTKVKRSYNGFVKTGQAITLESFSTKYHYDD